MTKKIKQIIKDMQDKLDYCGNKIDSLSEKLDLAYKFISSTQDKVVVNVISHNMLYGPLYSIYAYYTHCGKVYEVSNYITQSMFIALDMVGSLKAETISNNDKYIVFSVLGKNKEKFILIIDKQNNTLMEYPDISNIEKYRG